MKKADTIKVLKIEPNKAPYKKEVVDELSDLQAEVGGGLIEVVGIDDDCIIVCNEEGRINFMELNRRVDNLIIAGPFFICSTTEDGEFASLTDEQMEKFTNQFAEIPEFTELERTTIPKPIVIGFSFG